MYRNTILDSRLSFRFIMLLCARNGHGHQYHFDPFRWWRRRQQMRWKKKNKNQNHRQTRARDRSERDEHWTDRCFYATRCTVYSPSLSHYGHTHSQRTKFVSIEEQEKKKNTSLLLLRYKETSIIVALACLALWAMNTKKAANLRANPTAYKYIYISLRTVA